MRVIDALADMRLTPILRDGRIILDGAGALSPDALADARKMVAARKVELLVELGDIEGMMRRCVEIWQQLDVERDLATCERLVAEAEGLWVRIPDRKIK